MKNTLPEKISMDLLGSILNSMDGPPKVDEKQKQLIKSKYGKLTVFRD